MKKLVSVVLALLMLLSVAAFAEGDYRVAMITDYGDITDQSFNQTTYEACKAYCEANGIDFTYYKPNGDSTAERVAMVEKADDEGYNVIVMPGYAFGETIAEVQEEYEDTCFIALDVSEGDLGGAAVASNVYCAVYKEELCGYMAGYAAVKLGYTHLGFLGGMAVPAVVRYGFGFVQGVNAAAEELGIAGDVTVEYVYGNQFYGDADITAYMDNWYQTLGVQVVFACGGGIYSSAAEAAAKVDGAKVIGVDVDQSGESELIITSAMKELKHSVILALTDLYANNGVWPADKAGSTVSLGVADDCVGLPTAESSWRFATYTVEEYNALYEQVKNGEIAISNAVDAAPDVAVSVDYQN